MNRTGHFLASRRGHSERRSQSLRTFPTSVCIDQSLVVSLWSQFLSVGDHTHSLDRGGYRCRTHLSSRSTPKWWRCWFDSCHCEQCNSTGSWEVQLHLWCQVLTHPLCTRTRLTNSHFQVKSAHSGARHSRLDLIWGGYLCNVRPLDYTAPAKRGSFYCVLFLSDYLRGKAQREGGAPFVSSAPERKL